MGTLTQLKFEIRTGKLKLLNHRDEYPSSDSFARVKQVFFYLSWNSRETFERGITKLPLNQYGLVFPSVEFPPLPVPNEHFERRLF